VAAITHQVVVSLIGQGLGDIDFAALLELEARGANLALKPEHRDISDGLEAADGTRGEA
jgi:3-hydroxyisobutyrate dehydrogenase